LLADIKEVPITHLGIGDFSVSRFLVTGFPRFSSSALAKRALARF
jgi:hypothetical protein